MFIFCFMKTQINGIKNVLLIIILISNFYGAAFSQSRKELRHYSRIFKDTTNICNGERLDAWRYIATNYQLSGKKKKYIVKIFGNGSPTKYMHEPCLNGVESNEDWLYFVWCSCNNGDLILNTCQPLFFRFVDGVLKCVDGDYVVIH